MARMYIYHKLEETW